MNPEKTTTEPMPCLLTTVYTSGWAWRIHPRIYIVPAELVDGVSEAVLSVDEIRVRADLVLYLPRTGIALVWCREDLPVDIIPLSDANLQDTIRCCHAFVQPCQWTLPNEQRTDSRWGFDGQGRLLQFLKAGEDVQTGVRLNDYLAKELLAAWDHGEMLKVWECIPCGILDSTSERIGRCKSCGEQFQLTTFSTEDQDVSIQTLEKIIYRLGYDPVLCRQGPQAWVLHRGSAEMHLCYARDEASLCADVLLVKIGPETRRKELYKYLLNENIHLDAFGFSIQEDKVVISLLITARSIKEQETTALFEALLKKSDEYDNHLVSVFHAEWL